MKASFCASLIFAAGLAVSGAALAQPVAPDAGQVVATPPYPDTATPSPGIPSDQAVNPAPGARGPYIGAGRRGFYDVNDRVAAFTQAAEQLPPAQSRRAMSAIRSIKQFEATQRARHGGQLRDWDREAMNHRLDMLAQQFPMLNAQAQGPAPAQ